MLPILYAPVDDLVEDSEDEVRRIIAGSQYVDFTKLRVKDQEGEDYLTAVAQLADRLVEISAEVANRPEYLPGKLGDRDSDPKALSPDDDTNDVDDDALGILDAIAAQEELFPEWQKTIEKYGVLMSQVADITNKYNPKMTAAGKKNAAARLFVAKQYANELTPVADEFKENGSKYAEQAFTMNGLMSVILTNISEREAAERTGQEIQGFLNGARSLADSGRVSIESVQGFQDTIRDVAKMSRDVRKPLKTLSEGTQSFLDGQQLFDDWVRRIDKIELQDEQAEIIDHNDAVPESQEFETKQTRQGEI